MQALEERRDYLINHPDVAGEYADLMMRLTVTHRDNRVAYTEAKGEFVRRITGNAKKEKHHEPV